MRDVESPFSVFSASSFTFLVLLGLGFGLPLVANGAEVEAGSAALRCDVVGGAAMFALTHPIDLALPYPYLRRADLGAGRAVMRYDRAVMLMPSLAVLVPLSPPDLDGR
jgi:hypothetical protein